MKALVITSASGYDYSDTTVDAVYMVPDCFDPDDDYRAFLRDLAAQRDPRLRFNKNGTVHLGDWKKIAVLWHEHLTARFGAAVQHIIHDM